MSEEVDKGGFNIRGNLPANHDRSDDGSTFIHPVSNKTGYNSSQEGSEMDDEGGTSS